MSFIRLPAMCVTDNEQKNLNETCLTKSDWDEYISCNYSATALSEPFSVVFSKYLKMLCQKNGIKQKDIADATGIESTMITKYKNSTRKPTLKAVILLSLAMHLTIEQSEHMLYSAGLRINSTKEHRIYRLFLSGCAFSDEYSIYNCNKTLKKHGFEMLNVMEEE